MLMTNGKKTFLTFFAATLGVISAIGLVAGGIKLFRFSYTKFTRSEPTIENFDYWMFRSGNERRQGNMLMDLYSDSKRKVDCEAGKKAYLKSIEFLLKASEAKGLDLKSPLAMKKKYQSLKCLDGR
tara:strand:- start:123 stop:500 length:378 start_codon:yes stop_codon:yes gene_type:complete